MADPTPRSTANGALSVEVSALPIVAGTRGTVTLIIRNPFAEEIEIESIQAPSSEPLLPRVVSTKLSGDGWLASIYQAVAGASFGVIGVNVSPGPLIADFVDRSGRKFYFEAKPKSKIIVKDKFSPRDIVHVQAEADSEVTFHSESAKSSHDDENKKIPPYQEDVASFELRTAHWLFVTPKVLNLHAVIRYRLAGKGKSQVVPMALTVRPPLSSLILGSVGGAIFGFMARQLTSNQVNFWSFSSILSILGLVVMAVILSIVLSRDSGSKGFVTLEDFYGAFIVGVLLGYTGTSYFDGVVRPLSESGGSNSTINSIFSSR